MSFTHVAAAGILAILAAIAIPQIANSLGVANHLVSCAEAGLLLGICGIAVHYCSTYKKSYEGSRSHDFYEAIKSADNSTSAEMFDLIQNASEKELIHLAQVIHEKGKEGSKVKATVEEALKYDAKKLNVFKNTPAASLTFNEITRARHLYAQLGKTVTGGMAILILALGVLNGLPAFHVLPSWTASPLIGTVAVTTPIRLLTYATFLTGLYFSIQSYKKRVDDLTEIVETHSRGALTPGERIALDLNATESFQMRDSSNAGGYCGN